MSYGRLLGAARNRFVRGCGSLMGIAAGLLADEQLSDTEIRYLQRWLNDNPEMALVWPGDVLAERVRDVLADGLITESERAHLVDTLERICGGEIEELGKRAVNQLAFDETPQIRFPSSTFCVTGDFYYGPRERVHGSIVERGGIVQNGVTRKLNYLVVGLRGSDEWKHGSFGTKIEKAIDYKRDGVPLAIVREDTWTEALRA